MYRFVVPLLAFLVVGCSAPVKESEVPAVTTPTETPATTTATDPSGKSESEIPDSLKHDAYFYGGYFTKAAEQVFAVKIEGQPDGESKTTTRFTGMKDGAAMFERTREGVLSAAGSDVIRLDAVGATVVSVSIGKLAKPSLEIPAKLEPGATWKSDSKITTDTGEISQSGTYKVVGEEKVKVPAGEFTARKVILTGKMMMSGQESVLKGTYWFVKELGAVKTEIEQSTSGKSSGKIILELKK